MAFCPNCGSQMADGSKFCGSCGTVIGSNQNNAAPQQNVQPNYQQNVQPNYQQNVQPNYQQNFQQGAPSNMGGYNQQYAPQAPSAFGIAIGQIWKEITNLVKSPIETITKSKFDLSNAATYIFGGFMALLLILQSFWGAAQYRSKTGLGALGDLGDFGDLLGEIGGKSSFGGGGGLGSAFLTAMFHVLVMAAAIWGLTLLVNSVFMKGRITALHAMNVVLLIAVPYLVFSTVAVILNYISFRVGQMAYLSGFFVSFVLYYKALGTNIGKPESSLVKFFAMVPPLLYLANFIVMEIAGTAAAYFHGIFRG